MHGDSGSSRTEGRGYNIHKISVVFEAPKAGVLFNEVSSLQGVLIRGVPLYMYIYTALAGVLSVHIW